jgi:sugar transferase (PEP-CTERM system associated)
MLELFRSPRRAIVWFVEASLLALLGISAAGVMLGWAHALVGSHVLRVLLVSAVAQTSMYYHGLYGPRALRATALAVGLLRALLVAGAALAVLYHFFLPGAALGRGVFVAALSAAAVVLPAWRAAFERVAESPLCRRTALLMGSGHLGRACAEHLLARDHGTGLRLAGVLLQESETAPPGVPALGRYADVVRVCAEHGVDRIVVASCERRGTLPVAELLDLKLRGVEIEEAIDFYERVTGKIFVPALKPSDLVFARGYHVRPLPLALKRAFDVAAAGLGLLLSAPILAAAAIAIKLDSPGPVLYSQIRAGAFGRAFAICKLRSMRTDAEARGAVWAAQDDPRVTRVGRFLRRSRVDELPQLWNVLVGEMSLVGPRPERPVFVERLEREIPFFRQRLCMKPGVTGHAQVRCRYGASIDDAREKLEYDLFYIKRFSLWFDLSILIDTVKVVLLRIGSR